MLQLSITDNFQFVKGIILALSALGERFVTGEFSVVGLNTSQFKLVFNQDESAMVTL